MTVLNLVGHVNGQTAENQSAWLASWNKFFSFQQPLSLPNWFSTLVLAITGLAASELAAEQRRAGERWISWEVIAGVFVLLSVDEAMSIHGRLGPLLGAVLSVPVVPWVVIAVALAMTFCLLMLPLLLSLPRPTALAMVLAGVLFVLGAAGVEAVEGLLPAGGLDLPNLVEEVLEMVGSALFLVALVGYRDTVGRRQRAPLPSTERSA
ncbi:hypothetical protein [Georgenia yuyongxinii]|uniref:Uncharacterized protein n=1 Tax=Georgenia yuyongxinii TaxID=2589797 RepID=A0A552WLS3_9MICO|nr:hypothetical protein [Georgenia yuyongxinii]TRW43697.1 hypothetical protein FJ693_16640 [Georgenia yuyongxinii]